MSMKQGYKYKLDRCPRCGQMMYWNWVIRHIKSGCRVPKTAPGPKRKDPIAHGHEN